MIDAHDALMQVMTGHKSELCGAQTDRRGTLWTCVRPAGHEGEHAALDMTLRYWRTDDADRVVGRSRVEFRSRLLPREQKP